MDLGAYWQENKRFVSCVALGLVVFLVGLYAVGAVYGGDIQAAEAKVRRVRRELAQPLYTAADQTRAEGENDALRAAVEVLEEAARFRARPEFRLDPAIGSASNQYRRVLDRVQADLLPRANRADLTIDRGLGMPELSPVREEEIERYLEALDLVETAVLRAIDAGVRRVDRIQIRLDPGLSTRAGLGRVERTRVMLTLVGDSLSLTRFLASTQRPADGRVLHVDEIEAVPSRNKADEVRTDLTLVIVRPNRPVEEVEG